MTTQSAALQGATLAFAAQKTGGDGKRTDFPAPKSPHRSARPAGALLAATTASREQSVVRETRQDGAARPLSRQGTGASVQSTKSNNNNSSSSNREVGEQHGAAIAHRLSQYLNSTPSSPYLVPSAGSSAKPGPDPRSASFVAATLAASRSASPSPGQQNNAMYYGGYFAGGQGGSPGARGRTPRSRMVHTPSARSKSPGSRRSSVASSSADLPDTSSIPAATSLISLFEGKKEPEGGDMDPIKKTQTPTRGRPPSLRLPTPPRSLSPRPRPPSRAEPSSTNIAPGARAKTPPPKTGSPVPRPAVRPKPEPKPKPKVNLESKPQEEKMLPTITTKAASPQPVRVSPLARPELPSPRSLKQPEPSGRPLPLVMDKKMPKAPRAANRPNTGDSTSSDDTFVSASSNRSPTPRSPPALPTREAEAATVRKEVPSFGTDGASAIPPSSSISMAVRQTPSTQPVRQARTPPPIRRPSTRSRADLPLDSLTNAIVAGSLAAARHPPPPRTSSSPAQQAPPVPAPRRSGLHPPIAPHHSGSTSPRRTNILLTTLRQPQSKSDDEDARRHLHKHRKKVVGGKKHAHHEGSRKRWRDEITQRERRRYEAVWASNRGLFVGDGISSNAAADDLVANVVVRDIWSRSRLPFDELAEVWDLVDAGSGVSGTLTRFEFVVGMWLIDQRLRGRKIPARVSDSVWGSAKGVKVAGPQTKK